MKPILCPCCNRKFAKQETLLRHLNAAHRGKTTVTIETDQTLSSASGAASGASINVGSNTQTQPSTINISALASSCNQQQNARVTSIQALQATVGKAPPAVSTTTTSTACSTVNCTTNQVAATESNQTQQSVVA